MIAHNRVDAESCHSRFPNHPIKGKLRQGTLRLGVATSDVSVCSGEPDLFDILLERHIRFCKEIRHKLLWLRPTVEAEHASSFIDCFGVAKDPNARIGARIRQRKEAWNVEPIFAGYQQRGDRVPYPKKLNGHGSRVNDASKAPCDAEVILLTCPLIRRECIAGNIQLIRM